ncbi:hypothetical protein [Thermococcus peptonophilus]|uniref:hypothetical protein n=1 Tax=Thermococcus peptonophilus TaxID=53952 RepID=UPI000B0E50E3
MFDVFGSFKGIERDLPYVYQLKGYLDDGVFVTKYSDFVRALSGRISTRRIWLFSYLSSGVCKLFKNPKKTYQLIWSTKAGGVADKIPDIRAILVYDSTDCPEIENFIYTLSDIVVEVLRDNFERRAYITKGGLNPRFSIPLKVVRMIKLGIKPLDEALGGVKEHSYILLHEEDPPAPSAVSWSLSL